MASSGSVHGSALRGLLHATVTGDRDAIGDLVTDDVVGWSPTILVRSIEELLEAVGGRDDTFSGIEVEVRALDELGDKAIAEWHLAVDHTGPLFVDDDMVVQPTGRRLHLSGATIAEFDGDRICAFRSYFDDLALLEQALAVGVRAQP
ncbi:MAG TPA: ester cyclase [Acidimicrobiales bacterium]|nr:ester cyclase [Acidimicrobiales bacterium]